MDKHGLMAEAILPEPSQVIETHSQKRKPLTITGSGYDMKIVTGFQRRIIDLRVGLHILKLALKNYGSFKKALEVIRKLYQFKKSVLGGIETKLVKLNGKCYHSIYAPGYPSKNFDAYIETEFNRIESLHKESKVFNFIFFAITTKCPLNCEHCLEWDNLNSKETFTLKELQDVVAKFQKDGISQFHLSGGEPMVRVKDLVQVVKDAAGHSEFYILTSGYNFTGKNAKALKDAGLTGVVISLDHHEGEMHNAFRGFNNSYEEVLKAIHHAKEQNLLITLSLCATKNYITRENLIKYAELAKNLGAAFIQVLEPKAVGHYKGKDVHLSESHFNLLDKFFMEMNFSPAYKNYPVLLYHGYYQRRIGCLSGSTRNFYIDSKGEVNACPFCHTHNYNIKDVLYSDTSLKDSFIKPGCPQ